MDPEDLALFARSLEDATQRTTGPALDAALGQLGWRDALADDPRAAVSLLFEGQGAAGASSSALGQVMAHALGDSAGPGTGAVLPAVGGCDPPGTVTGNRLRVRGLALGGRLDVPTAVVVASSGRDLVAAMVPAASLEQRSVEGVDPDLGLADVVGDLEMPEVGADLSPETWAEAVALGRLALAHELVGASRAMLDLACEHARGRIQFGRPIATFQAVRHRLAETLVAISTAEAVLDAAWLEGTPGTAAVAKAVAGRQARTAGRHCQQVLAGIGFTVEHPFHRFVRRTLALDALLTTAASLTTALGAELVATRRLPPVLPL